MSTKTNHSRRRVLVVAGTLILLRLADWARVAEGQGTATPIGLMNTMAASVTAAVKADPNLLNAAGKGSPHFLHMSSERVLPYIDFMRITALATGRFWRDATPDQQKQLTSQFRDLILTTDGVQLCRQLATPGVYESPEFHPGDTNAEVFFHSADRPQTVQAAYRLELLPVGWKIMDMQLGGKWMVESYKQVIAQQIARAGIDGLIKYLADRNKTLLNQP